jgi:hypothetical protein
MKGLAGEGSQDRAARIGISAQDCKDRTVQKRRRVQPEQDCWIGQQEREG